MLGRAALGGIWIYQTYISPRKGFRCAYSVLHGGTGCSGYAKQAIQEHGAFGAIPHIRNRFRDCKAAHFTLRDEEPKKNRKRRKKEGWFHWTDCCSGCGPGDCRPGAGKGGSDCSPGDCPASGCEVCSCG
ncbi:membrane protein insertion efficiency factor YidD [Cognatiyoonia sp. IB215446]|uniref:membrane protein insertion efficiency factor YidD n=1 Tax=Cognatiyoonia sp. IB215446 TaxID=3097355 RepID=UPI0039B77FF2